MNSLQQSSLSLPQSLPQEILVNPLAAAEALRLVREERQRRQLERARQDIDQVRANCLTFRGFVKEAWPFVDPAKLIWNWHLDAMSDHLEAISRDQMRPRLIINVPPGSSKSTLVSVLWQAWEWGPLGKPGIKFLSTSYEINNVLRDTRKTRDLVLSEWYQMLWPEVRLIRTAEGDFENNHKGTRVGAAFGSLTAKRGDRLTIDDPHSVDGAESEAEREKAVRRFLEGGLNRLNDQMKSAIVVVMQRLHQSDLTGALLARDTGYEHLMLPMEFDPARKCVTSIGFEDPRTYDGELLDPARMPQTALDEIRKDNEYMYAGQYQQRPTPREGGMFKVERITGHENELIVDTVPPSAQRVRGWDIAGSKRKKSPFTVGVKLAWKDPILYVEDVVRERAEIEVAEQLIVDTCQAEPWVEQSLPQDPGSAGKSQKRHLAVDLAGLKFSITPETGEKSDRAIPFASFCNAGNVRLVRGPWNKAYIEELQHFPASTYKDQVDASSRAFAEMAKYMKRKRRIPAGLVVVRSEAEGA